MIFRAINYLFPSSCPVCNGPSDTWEINPFCSNCWQCIEPYCGKACQICGRPMDSAEAIRCSECTITPPEYERLIYFGLFEGALKDAIHLMKYRPIKRLARPLALLMSKMSFPSDADLIMPVPLHSKRLLEREFNQSAAVCHSLSKLIGIPFVPWGLGRLVNNPPQSLMNKAERRKNVEGIFNVHMDVSGKKVIILDDVFTTGATINECAKMVKRFGAKTVYAAAIARAYQR